MDGKKKVWILSLKLGYENVEFIDIFGKDSENNDSRFGIPQRQK